MVAATSFTKAQSANEKLQYFPQTTRDYQNEGIKAIRDSWAGVFRPLGKDGRVDRPLIAAATGAGKTTIIAEALRQEIDPDLHRVLVMAHREELIFQLHDRLANQFDGALDHDYGGGGLWGEPGLGIVMAERRDISARVIVATVQSLGNGRLAEILRHGKIDYLVIDEAHHAAIKSTSYMKVIEALEAANPKLKMLGVTATPKRTDDVALGSVWTHLAFEWMLEDGIKSGYLVPATRIQVATEVNIEGVHTQHGDYNQTELISALRTENWIDLCMDAFRDHALPVDRPVLSFLPSVAMSQEFTERLRATGVAAAHIDGKTPKDERRKILQDYRTGHVRSIQNCAVLSEGFDAPSTGVIFLARPTRSRPLFTQILGRGLRPAPGKEHCVLVDMTVRDTKALQTGTLLGRMVNCTGCGATYYYGLRVCPVCGKEQPAAEQPMRTCLACETRFPIHKDECPACGMPYVPEKVQAQRGVGVHLHTHYGSIFEEAFSAWYSDDHGYLTCGAGDYGTVAILPPTVDDYYRLIRVPKARGSAIQILGRNGDLASLMLEGDKIIKEQAPDLASKMAEWRSRPGPSSKQAPWVKKKKLTLPPEATMGDVSMMLTHAFSIDQIKKFTYDAVEA